MKITVNKNTIKVTFEGEVILAPRPGVKPLHIGRQPLTGPGASMEIVHDRPNQHMAYEKSVNVIGPPENAWEAVKLMFRTARWIWRIWKNRDSRYKLRHTWNTPNKEDAWHPARPDKIGERSEAESKNLDVQSPQPQP